MSKAKTPIVAIVGRANVGKSSLFNIVVGSREAVVAKEAGTTRDSVTSLVNFGSRQAWLVDTAGLKSPEDEFEATIQDQIEQAIDSADVILVTIESDRIIDAEDRKVAKLALKSKKPVVLVVNKIDKNLKADMSDYNKLGIKEMVGTSTTTKQGIDDFIYLIESMLPRVKSISVEDDRIKVALLGRPNAGKSALFNALVSKQQAIVSDRAGTTRDVNRKVVKFHEQEIEILDTAGIRRSGKIEVGIEKFSVLRSLAAIEESDVCLLLMDANQIGTVLDQKIAGLVKEAGKGLIIVISKWDSLEKDAYTRDSLAPKIRHDFDFVPWASLIFTSAETGQNVSKLFDLVTDIYNSRKLYVKTSVLNKWLSKVTAKHPPAGLKNTHPRLNYVTQLEESTPSFKFFGSSMKFLHWSYKRYLERELREEFGFDSTAIKFYFTEKNRPDAR